MVIKGYLLDEDRKDNNRMANKITAFLVEQGLIENEVRLVFQTGFDVLLSTVIQAAVILLLGMVMDSTIKAVFFLICFYSLRQYGGGFHAKIWHFL